MRLFGRDSGQKSQDSGLGERTTRPSSGWAALMQFLKEREGLRVLDFGPTSSGNINLLTGMGHSIYMADLVTDARRPEWIYNGEDGTQQFRVEDFLNENLDFSGRMFDVVLLWDTIDYLRTEARQPVIDRLHSVIAPSGRVLGFFHLKPEAVFNRYHLREDGSVDVQPIGDVPVLEALSNRQIEAGFHSFSNYRFFLAKDNLREVLVTS